MIVFATDEEGVNYTIMLNIIPSSFSIRNFGNSDTRFFKSPKRLFQLREYFELFGTVVQLKPFTDNTSRSYWIPMG
jgi:hypothetical protein